MRVATERINRVLNDMSDGTAEKEGDKLLYRATLSRPIVSFSGSLNLYSLANETTFLVKSERTNEDPPPRLSERSAEDVSPDNNQSRKMRDSDKRDNTCQLFTENTNRLSRSNKPKTLTRNGCARRCIPSSIAS